jgi:hypothetical protein
MIRWLFHLHDYHAEADTMASGADSLLIAGHIHFLPEPIYLRQFTEKIFEQYLKTSKRDSRYQATFVFNEPVSDTFNIQLVDTIVPRLVCAGTQSGI